MFFSAKNKVRMHDTDMAGILYFAKQFRFVHDAFEDFISSHGLNLQHIFKKADHLYVIVHAEADYLHSVSVGDELEIQLSVEKVGTTSFTLNYQIFRLPEKKLVGTAKTVHVCVDKITRKKAALPHAFMTGLGKYLTQ